MTGMARTTVEVGIDVTPLEMAMAVRAPHLLSCPPLPAIRANLNECGRFSKARGD
jgi:hypothetical protein